MKERLIELHDEIKKLTDKDRKNISDTEKIVYYKLDEALKINKWALEGIELKEQNLNLFQEPVE